MKGLRKNGAYGNLKMRGKKTMSAWYDWDDVVNDKDKMLKKEHQKEMKLWLHNWKDELFK